jgi:phospholipid N-methyltransferase
MSSNETDEIRERYNRRLNDPSVASRYGDSFYNRAATMEREQIYVSALKERFGDLSRIRFLEIGAGNGSNLHCFHSAGIPWDHIHANEMLDERIKSLRAIEHPINIIPGDAMDIDEWVKFDVVFQSTVFTSILDSDFRVGLANKMKRLLSEGGIILWYDFIYDNPSNHDVKGVSKKEIRRLFHDASGIRFFPVTLAPPIGRRTGRFYRLFNIFTFLRTHVVAIIEY